MASPVDPEGDVSEALAEPDASLPDEVEPTSVPLEVDASASPEGDVSEGFVTEGVAEAAELPPIAASRLAASVAAVSSEAPACVEVEVEVADDDGEEKPAAGRSGRRTSTYDAPAALGDTSTRASDSHLACGRMSLPKYTSSPLRIATVSPSGPLETRATKRSSCPGAAASTVTAASAEDSCNALRGQARPGADSRQRARQQCRPEHRAIGRHRGALPVAEQRGDGRALDDRDADRVGKAGVYAQRTDERIRGDCRTQVGGVEVKRGHPCRGIVKRRADLSAVDTPRRRLCARADRHQRRVAQP